jgi:hypothetical protein
MIPVTQTDLRVPGGNCYASCIASILEVSLGAVPNYIMEEDWLARFSDLVSKYGLRLVMINYNDELDNIIKGVTVIAGGISFRNTPHAVVWKDGGCIHDPHPDRSGLVKVEDVTLLVMMDASRVLELRIDS